MNNYTIKVIDKSHEYYGQELQGCCVYYDYKHIGNGGPDLYEAFTPDGDRFTISSERIDVDHYEAQRLKEEINILGANVGDTVMIIEAGSGGYSKDWDISKPHVISKISSGGSVWFDNYPEGGAYIFRPKVTLVQTN